MHSTLTPGTIGAVSLIVSILILFKSFILGKIKSVPRAFFILFLKSKARLRNKVFIISEKVVLMVHRSKIRSILFSQKDEWSEIIKKNFPEGPFELVFNKFGREHFESCDLVVPLTILDLRVCIENRNLLPEQAIPIPTLMSVEICDDKNKFNAFMIANGYGAYIPSIEMPMHYPYMLKKNIDENGFSTYIIENHDDEINHFSNLKDDSFYCQELIPGKYEYATHIIFKEGRILSSLNIRYTFEDDNYIKGKQSFICKEVCQSHHLELFTGILNKIGFEGICCFNFKEVNGKPMIFEINPRFGGSLTDYFFSFIRKLDNAA